MKRIAKKKKKVLINNKLQSVTLDKTDMDKLEEKIEEASKKHQKRCEGVLGLAYRFWYWLGCTFYYLNIIEPFKEIKWAYQRMTRGYSDKDTWMFSAYISEVMLNALLDIKKNSYSISSPFKTMDEWQRALSKIIKAMNSLNQISQGNRILYDANISGYYSKRIMYSKEDSREIQEGLRLFLEHFVSLSI